MSMTVQLEPEDIEVLLANYRPKREAAAAALKEWDERIARLENLLPPEGGDEFNEVPFPDDNIGRIFGTTPSGRVPRGKTRVVVEGFLKTRNGNGATIPEIAEATGTKYPTVRRIIKELEDSFDVYEEDSRWHWATPARTDLQEGNKPTGAASS